MTLPVSGTISMSQVSVELGYGATTTRGLGDALVRNLAGVPSGAIAFTNLHGKTNYALTNPTPGGTATHEAITPNAASASVYAHPDGVFVATGTGFVQFGNLWQTGIASSKYWRWTYVSGTSPNLTNMTAGTWYPVNASYYVGHTRSTLGTTTGVVALQLANDSGGSGATTAGNWTIQATQSV